MASWGGVAQRLGPCEGALQDHSRLLGLCDIDAWCLLTLLPCGCRPEGELRCVLAVIRHGDRTPKQKMKMKVTQEPLLALLHKYLDSKGKQAKLKVLDCFDT